MLQLAIDRINAEEEMRTSSPASVQKALLAIPMPASRVKPTPKKMLNKSRPSHLRRSTTESVLGAFVSAGASRSWLEDLPPTFS